MRPTRFGIYGVAFLALLYAAFFVTHYNNLFFLLLSFLTILFGWGAVAARNNLRAVEVVMKEPAPIASGASGASGTSGTSGALARIEVELTAPAPARRFFEVQVSLASGEALTGLLEDLDGRGTCVATGAPLARGVYAVPRVIVQSEYPFGLLRARRVVPSSQELVVYPAPAATPERRGGGDVLADLLGLPSGGDGDLQPSELRDHREGEGLRGVHWRASARRGTLVVQEWEGDTGNGIEVVLDRRTEPDVLEEALALLSALVLAARERKETLRLHTQGMSVTYGEGHKPWAMALRFLAEAEPEPLHGPAPPAAARSVVRLPRREVSRA